MSDEFKFYCKYCQNRLLANQTLLGTKIQCPSCDMAITVPEDIGNTVKVPEQAKHQK